MDYFYLSVISLATKHSIAAQEGLDKYLRLSKITADGDCTHEIKKHLLLGRKVMTNLDSILESRDIKKQRLGILCHQRSV